MAVYEYAETFTSLLQQKYAKELCSDALTQSHPEVKFINAQTIKLPRMTVSGWEPKKLEHDRDIEFWIDPMDIDETKNTPRPFKTKGF